MPLETLQSSKALTIIRDKIDEAHYVFYKAIIDDIADFRLNLLGINRDELGGLKIANQPIASQIGDQFVFVMNKTGQIGILQREPNFSYANLDVGGPKHIFGFPARCSFRKSADTGGLGIYGWDTAQYNNEPDMFVTSFNAVAAGQINITCEGTYRIVAQIRAENVVGANTVVKMSVTDVLTGTGFVTISTITGPPAGLGGTTDFHTLFDEETFNSGGGNVVVELMTGVTRLGAGVAGTTRIFITRVN